MFKLVKKYEGVTVHDLNFQNLIVSKTEISPGMSTRGHSHLETSEIYIFCCGEGEMQVGDEKFRVKPGDIVFVEEGKFHRVWNNSDQNMIFYCIFKPYRGRGR
ncbi:MAG: cupin domain-containing protein [Thermoplasmata archaeon]|nr:cupin domain-containing protein [Thermoplasmata archaeon]